MHMVGAILWTAVGAAAIFRGFFRPHRAVVKDGAVRRCAGDLNNFGICDPSDVIDTEVGADVFSTGSGIVAEVGPYFVNIVVENDAVVLMYAGIEPTVEKGQNVGTGQKIGTSDGVVSFAVTQFKPGGVAEYVPPSAWLAARGQKLVVNNTGSEDPYCVGGREIIVPDQNQVNCDLHAPRKAGFALLPVSIEIQ